MSLPDKFPEDAVDSVAAKIQYNLRGRFYEEHLAPRLRSWRVGQARFHSRTELENLLAELAEYQPPREL